MYDIIIIGGGIAGLTTAWAACQAGRSPLVLEAGTIGNGASGGLVGALSPFAPDLWNEKKDLQFKSLVRAGAYWQAVEAASGLPTGYRQSGRLQRITSAHGREIAQRRQEEATRNWRGRAHWYISDDTGHPFNEAPHGIILDTLSAFLNPRHALNSLAAAIKASGGDIVENVHALSLKTGLVETTKGRYFSTHIVLAAGYHGWDLARPHLENKKYGDGIKGQAAILELSKPWIWPLVTGNGFYIVPHDTHRIAIGSTKERVWTHMDNDRNLELLVHEAKKAFPILADAKIIEKWAGIRPRAAKPDPIVGPVGKNIWINSGGLGIGFGISPEIARGIVAMMNNQPHAIPQRFLPTKNRARR